MRAAVMACMRDEALFVAEWAAYHLAIGFDSVAICTNGCSDGTDEIVQRLSRLAPVRHIPNDDLQGVAPQRAGVLRVLATREFRKVDWLLHVDADEFLNIEHGAGRVQDLLPVIAPYDAAAFTWRLFGDAGLTEWTGGLVLDRLRMAEERQVPFTAMQKTMFRPGVFAGGIDHMPKFPLREVRLCNARGDEVSPMALHDPDASDHRIAFGREINRKRHFGWAGAWINHYAVRSRDLFLLKNARGDGIGSRFDRRYFLNSRWHRAANRNEVQETSILRHLPAVQELLTAWRTADPEIASLEGKALLQLAHRRRKVLTAERVSEWTNALSEAEATAVAAA